MIKLVVSDVDGTLLFRNQKEIDRTVFDAIEELKSKGIKVCVASGRTFGSLKRIFEPVKDGLYFICCDGAVTVIDDKVLYTKQISVSDVLTIVRCDLYKDCKIMLCTPTKSYTLCKDSDFINESFEQSLDKAEYLERLYDLKEPVCKIAVYSKEGKAKPLSFMPKSLRVSYLSKEWCEYTSVISNKGLAVSDLQMRMYLSKFDTVCIGDGENDIEMMKKAKIAISAMEAHPSLKEFCTMHADNVVNVFKNIASGQIK